MKLKTEILAAVQEAALAADIPISMVYGLVCQESSGNPKAKRFEPEFRKNYCPTAEYGKEADDRSTSWGLMQIMGQTARERGFKGEFEELLEPAVGLYWGCRQLNVLRERYFKRGGWGAVLAAYNAGSPRKNGEKYVNQRYVDGVLGYAANRG